MFGGSFRLSICRADPGFDRTAPAPAAIPLPNCRRVIPAIFDSALFRVIRAGKTGPFATYSSQTSRALRGGIGR